jgi:hypothetical protein
MSLITTRKLFEIAEIYWRIYDFSYFPAIVWFWWGKPISVLQGIKFCGRMLVNLYVDASWVVHQYSWDPYFMVHWLWLSCTWKFLFVTAMVLDVLNFICRLQENIEPVVLYKETSCLNMQYLKVQNNCQIAWK